MSDRRERAGVVAASSTRSGCSRWPYVDTDRVWALQCSTHDIFREQVLSVITKWFLDLTCCQLSLCARSLQRISKNAHARSQIGSWLFLARITLNCGRDDVRCLRRIAHECNYAHIYISDSTVWQRLTKQADSFDTPPPHGHPTPIRYSPHPLRQRRLVHHNDVLKTRCHTTSLGFMHQGRGPSGTHHPVGCGLSFLNARIRSMLALTSRARTHRTAPALGFPHPHYRARTRLSTPALAVPLHLPHSTPAPAAPRFLVHARGRSRPRIRHACHAAPALAIVAARLHSSSHVRTYAPPYSPPRVAASRPRTAPALARTHSPHPPRHLPRPYSPAAASASHTSNLDRQELYTTRDRTNT